MPMAHLLFVFDDGIVQAKVSEIGFTRHAVALGEAVLKLCLEPIREWTESGLRRVTSATVLNHGNCVNWVDEVQSMEQRVYMWSGNCLRPLAKLSDDELQNAKDLLDEEIRGRC
jgi:hypothetical protein